METKTALIVGASGLIGGHCLNLLLEDDGYRQVNVLARRLLPLTHPKLNQHIVDFNRFAQDPDMFSADHFFCCLGTTIRKAGSTEAFRKVDFTYATQAAALASKKGASLFSMVSSLGANPDSRAFYLRVKGEVEEAVRKLPFRSLHIFRPSLLLGERAEFRLGEKLGGLTLRTASFAMVGGLKRYRAIEGAVVAKTMVLAARTVLEGAHVFESEEIQRIYDAAMKSE